MIAVFRELAAFTPVATRYGAVCGSVGALAGFLAPAVGQSPQLAFALGFLLPLGPLVLLFNSARWVRRDLQRWENWHKEELITRAELRDLRKATLQAMKSRWYGPAATEPPVTPPGDEAGGPVGDAES